MWLTHHEADRAAARANRRDFQTFGYKPSHVKVTNAPAAYKIIGLLQFSLKDQRIFN